MFKVSSFYPFSYVLHSVFNNYKKMEAQLFKDFMDYVFELPENTEEDRFKKSYIVRFLGEYMDAQAQDERETCSNEE